MKVIRVTTSLDFGGIEKVFELHAKYYDKENKIIFASLCKGGNTQIMIQKLGYEVKTLGLEKATIPSLDAIKLLIKYFREEKPDVVHAAGAEANFHVTIAAKIAGIKRIICEEIGIPNHSLKARLIFRVVYSFADSVIAISNSVKDYLITSGEVPVGKIRMIYNPVEHTSGQSMERYLTDNLRFITVARLEPVKNIALLINAFGDLVKKYPKASLKILGDGSLKDELQNLVNSLGLNNSVHLVGYIPDPSLFLKESDYFVLPSHFEGFGLACVEAIQCGVLTLSTNSGGIPEFITEGKEGFLFNPQKKDELLAKMEKAIQLSHTEYRQMAHNAYDKIGAMFSPTRYIQELNLLYKN